ncbi:MAG: glycoside hydrolase family 2 protein [Chloroflexi bacterium]|nr:glycoside hydrolase family 2 protein [Chloroflexota bacterium]
MQAKSLSGSWQLQQVGKPETYQATVPGSVHLDLMAAGCIPDPFVADNELRVLWVAEQDWQFSRTFEVSPAMLDEDRVYLVCDGLDTLGQVEINGTVVGRFENMFRQYRWDVKSLLKAGENEIRFTFDSPVRYAEAHEAQYSISMPQPWQILGGPYLRKAPCQFGWDWGPMLPPIGIWKDLRLEAYSRARIVDAHVRPLVVDGKGVADVTVKVDNWGGAPLEAVLTVTAPDGSTLEARAAVDGQAGKVVVEVENPQLWWPNGYGEQPLYGVSLKLLSGNETLDTRSYQVGFRTLELRREPDQWGESFTFVVNGTPIFAKGADWIPADSFPTRISDEYLEGLIRSSADAHMNMLRVWGGGFYEEERFYDLCDRYGILIWQDFTFACNKYPTDEAFFENVRLEAIDNVRRLRHRASLALWCGNNEMEQGWVDWGWNNPNDPMNQQLKIAYDRMYHHLLPRVVETEDPDHAYWPSSASSGIPFSEPNSENRGDCHYWDVWHGRKPFTAYRETYPRFQSEFGFQSLPTLETIKTFAEEKDWNMTSYIMEHHQRNMKGNGLIIAQMTDTFRMPKDFPMLVYLSMVLQAEGIRYGVEHWRRNKHRVSGTLYWQLNDCWPVASWSSIDYYGRWKALHYMARRFYAPVLLSVEDDEKNAKMNVWVTSDVVAPWSGEIKWKLVTLGGETLESGAESVSLAPQASQMIFSRSFTLTPEQRRSVVFICELEQDGKLISRSVNPFIANKHLDLASPNLKVGVAQEGGQAVYTVTGESLARFVELSLTGADVIFSDNYFDVPAGVTVQVTSPIPAGWTIEQVRAALKVTSLYDSF